MVGYGFLTSLLDMIFEYFKETETSRVYRKMVDVNSQRHLHKTLNLKKQTADVS
jgi:hypothetical protein